MQATGWTHTFPCRQPNTQHKGLKARVMLAPVTSISPVQNAVLSSVAVGPWNSSEAAYLMPFGR